MEAGTRERSLRQGEWRTPALLGVPSLVLALAVTAVTTYLPVRLQTGRASTAAIGLLSCRPGRAPAAMRHRKEVHRIRAMMAHPWPAARRAR